MSSFLSQLKRHSLPGEHSIIEPFEKTRRKSRVVIITNKDYPYNLSDSVPGNVPNDRRTVSESGAMPGGVNHELVQNHEQNVLESHQLDKSSNAKNSSNNNNNSGSNEFDNYSKTKSTNESFINQNSSSSPLHSLPAQNLSSSTSPPLSVAASPKTNHPEQFNADNDESAVKIKHNNDHIGYSAVEMNQNISSNSHISSEILDMYRSSSSDTSSTISNPKSADNEEFGTWHSYPDRRNSENENFVGKIVKVCNKTFFIPVLVDTRSQFCCVLNFFLLLLQTNFFFITRRLILLHHHQNT